MTPDVPDRYQEAPEALEEALILDPCDITALNNICLLRSRLRRDNDEIEYHARADRLRDLRFLICGSGDTG